MEGRLSVEGDACRALRKEQCRCVQQIEDTLGSCAGRFFSQKALGGDSKAKGTKVNTGKKCNLCVEVVGWALLIVLYVRDRYHLCF